MKKVFITGSAGFIGFHLTKSLLDNGHQVHGYDGMTDYYDVKLKHARNKILKSYGIGMKCINPDIYRKAFVHKSYTTRKNENFVTGNVNCPENCLPLQEECNEIFEFLGDSVLTIGLINVNFSVFILFFGIPPSTLLAKYCISFVFRNSFNTFFVKITNLSHPFFVVKAFRSLKFCVKI